jgi:hypothetical protein
LRRSFQRKERKGRKERKEDLGISFAAFAFFANFALNVVAMSRHIEEQQRAEGRSSSLSPV